MVGKRLKITRKYLGITQSKAASDTGISTSALRKYESGKIFPRTDFVEKFIREYNVNPGWLFTGEGEMIKEPPPNNAFVHLDNKIEKLLDVVDQFSERFILSKSRAYHHRVTQKPDQIKFHYFEALLRQRNFLVLKIKEISNITEVIKYTDIFENILNSFSKAMKKLQDNLEKEGIIINELDYDLDMETLHQLGIICTEEYNNWKSNNK
jgi:transcriptional regulator with XRE-family HTH domain